MYEGLVTIDDDTISLGIFNIWMTNRSHKHIKVNNNQTMGRLQSCEENQICTVHEIVTFDQNPREGNDDKSEKNVKRETHTMSPQDIPEQLESR